MTPKLSVSSDMLVFNRLPTHGVQVEPSLEFQELTVVLVPSPTHAEVVTCMLQPKLLEDGTERPTSRSRDTLFALVLLPPLSTNLSSPTVTELRTSQLPHSSSTSTTLKRLRTPSTSSRLLRLMMMLKLHSTPRERELARVP